MPIAIAMIFIDFGLLCSPYCKICYLLNCTDLDKSRFRNCAWHWQCHLGFPLWKAFSFYWL